jgi:hypothetical protein
LGALASNSLKKAATSPDKLLTSMLEPTSIVGLCGGLTTVTSPVIPTTSISSYTCTASSTPAKKGRNKTKQMSGEVTTSKFMMRLSLRDDSHDLIRSKISHRTTTKSMGTTKIFHRTTIKSMEQKIFHRTTTKSMRPEILHRATTKSMGKETSIR